MIKNKSLNIFFFVSFFLCISVSLSYAADFILPNSSGEPVVIDISNLNSISDIDVTIGDFSDQPRPYRDENTNSLVIFPPPVSNSEKTIEVRAGSSSVTKTISFRSSPGGVLKNSVLPDLKKARGGNTITKLSDGRIVLIGGSKELANKPLDSLEVFNPEDGMSEYLTTPDGLKREKLKKSRSQHTATHIGITSEPVGKITGPVEQILLTGGFSDDGVLEDSLEIIEIKIGTNQCTSTLLKDKKSKLKKARLFHTANLLPDGRVLITGGQGRINMTSLGALNSIEIYDPLTMSIVPSGISLNTSRLLHTATTLQNGNILIVGGFTNEKQDTFGFGPATDKAELIDISNITISNAGSLFDEEKIGGHTATLLTNGVVLISGGSSHFFASRAKDGSKGLTKGTLQFYNPSDGSFKLVTSAAGGNLELQTSRFLHQTVLLPNGSLVTVGGLNIKEGLSSTNILSTPVSTIEVLEPNLLTFTGGELKIEQKLNIQTTTGRIQPTVALVTPNNKTQGLLLASDASNFLNSAVFITGGFANGLGKLPVRTSELLQTESNNKIEGREIKTSPQALIQGNYLSELLIELDKFFKVPALRVEPQTVNLSVSNSFMANIKVFSSNNEVVLLKAENQDSNNPIVISPSLFQAGESISISRKNDSISGEFEIKILPADSTKDFIAADVKVNVGDSSKPFLATVPGNGVSLSTEVNNNVQTVQIKVLSQDGSSVFTSVPSSTQVTATISDSQIANLGGTGISSVVGTLATQFTLNAVKPGMTNLNFTIDFPDILSVAIPIEVSGTPSFNSTPIDTTVLAALTLNGIELASVKTLNPTTVSVEDVVLPVGSDIFPLYVPINLQSSVDNSVLTGLFTIRPIFGVDLLSAIPRTFTNKQGSAFASPLDTSPISIGGIATSTNTIAALASSDGLRTLNYSQDINENLENDFNMINNLSAIKDLDLFDVVEDNEETIKISTIMGSMLFVLDASSGNEDLSINLTASGFEQELIMVGDQVASVVSVGEQGVDFVLPLFGGNPRIVTFQLPGVTKNIAAIEKLDNKIGPFAIAYDGNSTISIVNLLDINAVPKTIDTEGEKITKIDYAGRFVINGKVTDVLCASSQREILLFDLNNLTSISVDKDLKIKTKIEDLLVIDGIAYLALGSEGILAVSIASLLDSNEDVDPIVASFKKNKLIFVKSSGKETIVTKPLNSNKLADSKPFLLSSGEDNNLTVIRVSP